MYICAQEGKADPNHAESGVLEVVENTQEETSCVFTPVTTPKGKAARLSCSIAMGSAALAAPHTPLKCPPNIKESHKKWKVAHGKEFWEKRLACRKSSALSKRTKHAAGSTTKAKINEVLYQSIQRARETSPWDYFLTQVVEECSSELQSEELLKETSAHRCDLTDCDRQDNEGGSGAASVVGLMFQSSIKRRLDFMFEDLDEDSDEGDEVENMNEDKYYKK
jgi:hypothetical protein